MVQIKTSDVNNFLKRTGSIKQNGLLPILEYVQFRVGGEGKAHFYDTNLNIWCRHEVDVEAKKEEVFLLDRKILSILASSTKKEFIYLKQVKTDIILYDGEDKKDNKIIFKIPDTEVYPKFPEGETEEKKLSVLTPEFIEGLGHAKQFINTVTEDYLSFVHVFTDKGKTQIVSSDRSTMFVRQFDAPVSDLLISGACADIISGYQTCTHYAQGNYDFYDFGSTVFSFIKTEQQRPPFEIILNNYSDEKRFIIDRKLLLEYNNICLKMSPFTYTLYYMVADELDENGIRLVFNLSQYGINNSKTLPVESNFKIERFDFNGNQIEKILKASKNDRLIFCSVGPAYFIREENNDKMTMMVQGYAPEQIEAMTSPLPASSKKQPS